MWLLPLGSPWWRSAYDWIKRSFSWPLALKSVDRPSWLWLHRGYISCSSHISSVRNRPMARVRLAFTLRFQRSSRGSCSCRHLFLVLLKNFVLSWCRREQCELFLIGFFDSVFVSQITLLWHQSSLWTTRLLWQAFFLSLMCPVCNFLGKTLPAYISHQSAAWVELVLNITAEASAA